MIWEVEETLSDRRIFRTLKTLDQVRTTLQSIIHAPVPNEEIVIENSMDRLLAEDIISTVDVPSFDRATMDGYAVKAQDTFGADETRPRVLKVVGRLEPGKLPSFTLSRCETSEIATGATLPIGANAVVMVEYTRTSGQTVEIFRSVTPGENVMAAGSDIMAGELVLRRGQLITSREVGVLAAVGKRNVKVLGSPKVAIISTGNELVAPGSPLTGAKIYDINASALAAAVLEAGGTPIILGIASDNEQAISSALGEALKGADIVLTSGSTSAGRRDLLPRIISSIKNSSVIVDGLAVKPGKPALAALVGGKPMFALPGNPTSALMVFHEIVKPTIGRLAGRYLNGDKPVMEASLALKTFSARGRQELLPVHMVTDESGRHLAYPILSGSGAITSFALADGFIRIAADRDVLNEGEKVKVHLFSPNIRIPDLVIIGSHCVGIDIILRMMSKHEHHTKTKVINVGSLGGLNALRRGETDLAGIHLLDEESGDYNIPFIEKFSLRDKTVLIRGYSREQGFIAAKGNPKGVYSFRDLLQPGINFINRNVGSGTRILIDMNLAPIAKQKQISLEQLAGQIQGYDVEAKSHSTVASAILQGRADVGFGIRTVAVQNDLTFVPHSLERFDFAISKNRMHKDSVRSFIDVLRTEEFKLSLEKEAPGLLPDSSTGNPIPLDRKS